jgi:predicted extracellular nuclease
MKLNNTFLILIAIFFSVSCNTAPKILPPYTVVFYNVENLFDTISNTAKMDYDFLPDGPKEWNTARYFKKLDDLARVIYSIDSVKLPVLVGLCEVENDVVLNDLISRDQLKKAGYAFIWEEGTDIRGIDCALLYQPDVFKLNNFEYLPVVDHDDYSFVTREILYVNGYFGKELFHVLVNHWPSRRGGAFDSAIKRVLAASMLRHKVDEILESEPRSNIIIMGDMNDEPSDMSLSDILMALPSNIVPSDNDLINLMYDDHESGKGSYNYQGKWNMIDNIIVSGYLINKAHGLKTTTDNGFIFHLPFMEYTNSSGEMSPNRTYGRTYFGGTSDHFPVFMTLDQN